MKDWIGVVSNVGTFFVAIVGVCLVYEQLHQANDHQKWNNYNQLNLQYHNWYDDMPSELEADRCRSFRQLPAKGKRWVRSYFDLYTEEYWLYLQGYIPPEMWTDRIDKGVNVNLISYPVLVEGYNYWKAQGAFAHPPDFVPLVDKKIAGLEPKLAAVKKQCQKKPKDRDKSFWFW